ncbi:hypothetical protein [Robertkochia aurantiaca]|uniref:hypothetical protein n=1 Tax=Robertkochia aurantiaca TaxID=2873700 RepID=UPI001CCA5B64|nr:hypothetical protein [Robertkochia sp. 3YJGBD-33]
MKIFTIILLLLAVALIGYNATLLDFDNLLQGDSMIALIGIVAALCAVLLLIIFNLSKRIQQKLKDRK